MKMNPILDGFIVVFQKIQQKAVLEGREGRW
jgi:hypothetical protein